MSNPAAGQPQHQMPSSMTARQVNDYMSLLVEKHESLGEFYVARQLAWAELELDRIEGRA